MAVGYVMCLGMLAGCAEQAKAPPSLSPSSPRPVQGPASNAGHLQATYWIDGEPITLLDGRTEHAAAPGSATKLRTSIWEGSAVHGDLDGDGDEDVALVLVQDPGGSGTFSYLVAAVQANGRYEGSHGLFLGDRIDRPAVSIHAGLINVQFRDHSDHTSFADSAVRDRVVRAKLVGLQLDEQSAHGAGDDDLGGN
jgi:hypothetical protein